MPVEVPSDAVRLTSRPVDAGRLRRLLRLQQLADVARAELLGDLRLALGFRLCLGLGLGFGDRFRLRVRLGFRFGFGERLRFGLCFGLWLRRALWPWPPPRLSPWPRPAASPGLPPARARRAWPPPRLPPFSPASRLAASGRAGGGGGGVAAASTSCSASLHLGGTGRRRRNVPLRLAGIALFLNLGDAVDARVRLLRLHFLGARFAARDLGELVVGEDLDRDAFLGFRKGARAQDEEARGEDRGMRRARHPDARLHLVELQPHLQPLSAAIWHPAPSRARRA